MVRGAWCVVVLVVMVVTRWCLVCGGDGGGVVVVVTSLVLVRGVDGGSVVVVVTK